MIAPPSPTTDSRPLEAQTKQSSIHGRTMLKRMAVFAIIISTILLGANGFVCATWSHFSGMRGWLVWQAIPGLLAVAFIATTIIGFRYSNALLRIVYGLSAAGVGALSFTFFAAVACWLVAGIAWMLHWPIPRLYIAEALFGLALLATIYGLINAAWLRTTQITVKLPNLPDTWKGRSIALVTDLHLGHLSGEAFLCRIIARLRDLQPNAVFISGDLFDGTTAGLDRLIAGWREYAAPLGIFYVTGNHDEFAERIIYLEAVKRTGIHVLNNEKVSLEGLQIVGVHDSEGGDPTALRSILDRAELDPLHPSILLAHRPENLAVAEEAGISLQLSGHTHKGQFWPWTMMVSRIYGRFAYGLNRLQNLQVYTSSGAGTWGPPLRVGTKSEIVLIRLE